jgi:2-keto-4-pentenoate hydratase
MADAHAIAKLLLDARAGGALVDAREDNAPTDPYAVQDVVLRALAQGRRTTLWKAIPPRGGAPFASPVPAPYVFDSPARVSAEQAFLGVEAEIAFRLDERLQPGETLVLIEVCSTRLGDWTHAPTDWKLADFQSNAGCVVGSGTRRAVDWRAQRAEVFINGKEATSATGSHPSHDPSVLLPWLIEHARTRGGLIAGDIVTTGSWTGIVKAARGDEIAVRFPGIGEARVTLT